MNIPLNIDLSSLLDTYDLSQQNCDDIVDYVIEEITAEFATQWKTTALNTLGSTKNRYASHISVIEEGRLMRAVVLDYTKDPLVQMIEEGAGAFDMKDNFLKSPKAKTNKSGGKYLIIPFKWGTPDTVADNATFSNTMPKEVYSIAKNLAPKQQITNTQLSKLQGGFETQSSKMVEIPKSKKFEEYTHKSSIYKGISKGTSSTTNQSTYTSFRVVSEKSDEASWIHPGIKAYNIAELALSDFKQKIQPLMTQAIDNALNSIGIT